MEVSFVNCRVLLNVLKLFLDPYRELAATFQYELVAEFVADEDIYDMVKELDIQYAQGYYLGKPQPIEVYLDQKD